MIILTQNDLCYILTMSEGPKERIREGESGNIFVRIQKKLVDWKLVKHKGRQRYHVGWLAPGKKLEDLRFHLHSQWGFGNHFVSFTDDEQVLNWRKITADGMQYHLRVFRDGEMRGHFETMPEGHFFKHFKSIGIREAKAEFVKFLGDFMVEKKHISKLEPVDDSHDPESETI